MNDGELLSGRGSEAVNERAAQVSYTSAEINVPSNLKLIILGAGNHAADVDVESRPSVEGHVAIGSQQASEASAAPWRHGSIGRGNAADWAGAAKRSPGNIHQTAGSVTIYQQGTGVNRRGAGVGIRGVAESQDAGPTLEQSARAAHLTGPSGTNAAANVGANASTPCDRDAAAWGVDQVPDSVEDEVVVDGRISQRGEKCEPARIRIIRRDRSGGKRAGGVGDEAIVVRAINNERGRATGCAIEGHLRVTPCLAEPEATGVAVVTRKVHAPVDDANEGGTGDVTGDIRGTSAGRTAALNTKWSLERDVATEGLRAGGVT